MYNSLSHSKWDCKYHLVFIPKRRKSTLYNGLRAYLRNVFHELARQKECTIVEGHLRPDHVHMCIQIPPKHAVSSIVGFLKGKSAIAIARYQGKEKNFSGENFWARGYCISTIGYEEATVRKYIREQKDADEFGKF
jgi:putative transposase